MVCSACASWQGSTQSWCQFHRITMQPLRSSTMLRFTTYPWAYRAACRCRSLRRPFSTAVTGRRLPMLTFPGTNWWSRSRSPMLLYCRSVLYGTFHHCGYYPSPPFRKWTAGRSSYKILCGSIWTILSNACARRGDALQAYLAPAGLCHYWRGPTLWPHLHRQRGPLGCRHEGMGEAQVFAFTGIHCPSASGVARALGWFSSQRSHGVHLEWPHILPYDGNSGWPWKCLLVLEPCGLAPSVGEHSVYTAASRQLIFHRIFIGSMKTNPCSVPGCSASAGLEGGATVNRCVHRRLHWPRPRVTWR